MVCLAITIVQSLLTRIWDHRYGVTLRSENKYRDSTLSWWFCASPCVVQGSLSCWRHPRSDHTEVSVRHLFCTYFFLTSLFLPRRICLFAHLKLALLAVDVAQVSLKVWRDRERPAAEVTRVRLLSCREELFLNTVPVTLLNMLAHKSYYVQE